MEPLSPIFIASWADDVDEYEADECQNVEEAMCQPDVSTAQVAQLKAAAAALCLRHPSQTAKQQEGCFPIPFDVDVSCYSAFRDCP